MFGGFKKTHYLCNNKNKDMEDNHLIDGAEYITLKWRNWSRLVLARFVPV